MMLMMIYVTGQVQVEGAPVKVQLLDTAGQVRIQPFLLYRHYFCILLLILTLLMISNPFLYIPQELNCEGPNSAHCCFIQ